LRCLHAGRHDKRLSCHFEPVEKSPLNIRDVSTPVDMTTVRPSTLLPIPTLCHSSQSIDHQPFYLTSPCTRLYLCRKNKPMQTFIKIVLILHVVAGTSALISGALSIIFKSNTPRHKRVGRIYFWCMSFIFVSAIFLSIARQKAFFFYIAIFTYYATLVAYRALKLKNLHKGQKPAMLDWLIQIIAGLAFLGLVGFAVLYYIRVGTTMTLVPFIFGCMGLLGVYRNSMRLIRGPKETLYWLKLHIGHMMGSYIGAITAFLVNEADHIPVEPTWLWLGPTVILFPIIRYELKKVKSQPLDQPMREAA
jgi:uncharacterized membrane protein